MKKHTPYIYIILALIFASCTQSELPTVKKGKGTLALNISAGYMPRATTRAIDNDLALTLIRPDGSIYKKFEAGKVPSKITLEADVTYTIRAYSDNQSTWAQANQGSGEACYFGETTVTVGEDETVYCSYQVPMTNYAVTFTLPELFDQLFTNKTFTLKKDDRTIELKEPGQKAYFAPDKIGFKYQLQATNTDGKTSRHSFIDYSDVEAGKLYNIRYIYSTDLNTGGIDIDITDNTEHEDVDINL